MKLSGFFLSTDFRSGSASLVPQQTFQQFLHPQASHRIAQVRRDSSQRPEHEESSPEARVWNLQSGFIDNLVAEQDEIEIEGAGRTWIWPLAAELALDGLQLGEEGAGVERRRAGNDRVEKKRLAGEQLPSGALRVGFDNVRKRDVREDAGKTVEREGQGGPPVPEVAAERDSDRPGR